MMSVQEEVKMESWEELEAWAAKRVQDDLDKYQ